MQRGAGDEGFVLRAVEPVAREGMTEVCHVDAKLMRATRLWAQAQEREAEKQKRLNEAEAERAELKRTIEKMKSEAAKGRDDAAVRLNIKFEAAQEAVGGVMEALADIEDTAKHDKFKSAIVNTIEKILKESD